MRATRINRARAILDQRLRHLHQRSRRIDQVVNDQASRPVDVADHVHHFRHVHLDAPLIDDGQRRVHLLRKEARPFHAARVRRNHRQVRQIQLPEIIHQHRRREQVVHRNIKKSLQLRRVQIDNQRPIRARRGQQIGHQLRRNRHSRLVFAILPRIAVIRNHRRDPPRRRPLQRVHHQQQLHQMHVHRMASGLHHEHVRAAHVLLNLHVRFAIFKARHQRLPARQAKKIADLVAERLVGGSAEDLESVVDPGALRLAFRFLVRDRLFFRRSLFSAVVFSAVVATVAIVQFSGVSGSQVSGWGSGFPET